MKLKPAMTREEMEALPWVLGLLVVPPEVTPEITVVYKVGFMDEMRPYFKRKINGRKLFFYGMAPGKTWNGITYEEPTVSPPS